jgi:hypothetical protein
VCKTARPRILILFAIIALAGIQTGCADPARDEVEQVVTDYIALYSGPTLDRWRGLFHPAVGVAFPDDGGSIRTRMLEEFVTRQKNYFATGRRIARVSADLIFKDEGEERPGKRGLHLAQGKDGWKIVVLVFSYNAE